jgi:predicted helicase
MEKLNLKPKSKHVLAYYEALEQFKSLKVSHESAVRAAFQNLLEACCRQFRWALIAEWPVKRAGRASARVDGALVDEYRLTHGFWEAKDAGDDLPREVKKKFEAGYPTSNILFQAPERAILWQNNREVLDADLTNPDELVKTLSLFFEYQPPAYEQWEQAVEDFQTEIPEFGRALTEVIEKERKTNKRFREAFTGFYELCRQSINPNLSERAVEEMLIQHILTERIFRTVFKNSDFTRRNVIAHEIEKVIDALTAQAFSREEFLRRFDHFYRAIETTAATIEDFAQKQEFLNAVYEKFFQGFSVKVADTHGIVYTPQPIVNFMVRSVEEILHKEFGKSLSSKDVHILDPFVGTGNFIVRVMQEIKRTQLEQKYKQELHCNEVMLLPYYIASMNIEHEFYELAGAYEPFEGICLVDTFELAEAKQISFFSTENTERVERQKRAPITVVIGNPPYNVGQLNENDNNKNRKYKVMDKRVAETYAKDSKATNKNALSDPYVKAIRWASDRIIQNGQGIVALVTNNSFIDNLAFDGMRQHLEKDFDSLYVLDLGGNVRKNPKLSGTTHNVFGIQVGVSINIFVRKRRRV